jgi:hypothetical protein
MAVACDCWRERARGRSIERLVDIGDGRLRSLARAADAQQGVGDLPAPKGTLTMAPNQDADVTIAVACRLVDHGRACCAP